MAMDLESDPTPTPAPVAETPPAPAETSAPVTPPEELNPADLVDAEKAKGLIGALKATREELKAAKEKAAKADQYEQYFTAKAPYIKVLEENPNIFQQATQPRPAPAPPSPDADPELVELARSLDYYKADGTPDVARASKHAELIDKRAVRLAQQMVAPVAQNTYEQRTAANFTHFASQKLPNGQTVDQNVLAKYFRSLPANYTADPRVAAVAFNLAAMEQMSSSPLPPNPQPPAAAPLHTEPLGGVPRSAPRISEVERAIVGQRGISDKAYQELTKGFTAGRTSSLEDE